MVLAEAIDPEGKPIPTNTRNAANAIFINSLRGSGGTPTAPAITSATTASATVGTAFSYTITASNNATSYGATGLPAGLTVNSTSGLISGTPTTAGNSSATISATNTGGTGNATLAFTIARGTPVINTPPTASAITAGQALSSSTLTGGNASVAGTFAFATPSFLLSATGTQTVVFTPTDAANYTTANTSVTVTVNAAPVAPFTSWTGGNVTITPEILSAFAIGGSSWRSSLASTIMPKRWEVSAFFSTTGEPASVRKGKAEVSAERRSPTSPLRVAAASAPPRGAKLANGTTGARGNFRPY
jgi:hypothetical protein